MRTKSQGPRPDLRCSPLPAALQPLAAVPAGAAEGLRSRPLALDPGAGTPLPRRAHSRRRPPRPAASAPTQPQPPTLARPPRRVEGLAPTIRSVATWTPAQASDGPARAWRREGSAAPVPLVLHRVKLGGPACPPGRSTRRSSHAVERRWFRFPSQTPRATLVSQKDLVLGRARHRHLHDQKRVACMPPLLVRRAPWSELGGVRDDSSGCRLAAHAPEQAGDKRAAVA